MKIHEVLGLKPLVSILGRGTTYTRGISQVLKELWTPLLAQETLSWLNWWQRFGKRLRYYKEWKRVFWIYC